MAKLTVHAGDFPKGKASISSMFGMVTVTFTWQPGDGLLPQSLSLNEQNIESLEMASEESVKRLGGTVGWGVAGAMLLGPAGMLAGLLAGGRGKDVTFVLKLNDGRRMLATTDSSAYTKLQALTF